jgi:predicted transposase/invertase (TIGR01784 family)
METDSYFYKFFKTLPRALFQLLGQSGSRARWYRFDSVELKKALRIDGMFVPRSSDLPLYFLEVQFQRVDTFYANLFAKVFCYLEENNPSQDWIAVVLFESRRTEPVNLTPYEVLIASRHVHRIYLDEHPIPANAPIGLGILRLLNTPKEDLKPLVRNLATGSPQPIVELIEEMLIRRYPEYGREELRQMFHLSEIQKTKVWQEAREEGRGEGREEGIEIGAIRKEQELVRRCLAQGKSIQEIAELFGIPLKEVRRLAKDAKA